MKLKDFRIESEFLDGDLEVAEIIHDYHLKQGFRYMGKQIKDLDKNRLEKCLKVLDGYIKGCAANHSPYSMQELHTLKETVASTLKNFHE